MASPTPNKGYTYPAHGGAVGAWDTPLNANFDQIDLNVGGVYLLTYTATAATVTYNSTNATFSSTVNTLTLPSSYAQNLTYIFSGSTQAISLVFPGNVGGIYNVWNNSTQGFSVTALTTVAGSSGVAIPAGYKMLVCSDGTNIKEGDNYFTSLLGTSGTKIPYLDGVNTWSGGNTFTAVSSFTGATVFSSDLTAVRIAGSVVATSATQETATSSNTVVTPLVQQYHPSAGKAWASVTCSTINGAQTLGRSYNISSVSRTGTGIWTATMSVTFSSSHYDIQVSHQDTSRQIIFVTSQSTNSFTFECQNVSGTNVDPIKVYIHCDGDQ